MISAVRQRATERDRWGNEVKRQLVERYTIQLRAMKPKWCLFCFPVGHPHKTHHLSGRFPSILPLTTYPSTSVFSPKAPESLPQNHNLSFFAEIDEDSLAGLPLSYLSWVWGLRGSVAADCMRHPSCHVYTVAQVIPPKVPRANQTVAHRSQRVPLKESDSSRTENKSLSTQRHTEARPVPLIHTLKFTVSRNKTLQFKTNETVLCMKGRSVGRWSGVVTPWCSRWWKNPAGVFGLDVLTLWQAVYAKVCFYRENTDLICEVLL